MPRRAPNDPAALVRALGGGSGGPRRLRLFACACVRRLQQWLEEGTLHAPGRRQEAEQPPDRISAGDALAALERFADTGASEEEREALREALEQSQRLDDHLVQALGAASGWRPEVAAQETAAIVIEASPVCEELVANAAQAAVERAYEVLTRSDDEEQEDEGEEQSGPAEWVTAYQAALAVAMDEDYSTDASYSELSDRMRAKSNAKGAARTALAMKYLMVLADDMVPEVPPKTPISPAWRTSNVLGLAQSFYEGGQPDVLPVLADALEESGCSDPAILAHLRSGGLHVRGCWAVDLVLAKQ